MREIFGGVSIKNVSFGGKCGFSSQRKKRFYAWA